MRRKDFRVYSYLSILFYTLLVLSSPIIAATPDWTGQGTYRIIVKTEPVVLTGSRSSDQLVARYEIDFDALVTEYNASGMEIIRISSGIQQGNAPVNFRKQPEHFSVISQQVFCNHIAQFV